jgi:hypothetical protein
LNATLTNKKGVGNEGSPIVCHGDPLSQTHRTVTNSELSLVSRDCREPSVDSVSDSNPDPIQDDGEDIFGEPELVGIDVSKESEGVTDGSKCGDVADDMFADDVVGAGVTKMGV